MIFRKTIFLIVAFFFLFHALVPAQDSSSIQRIMIGKTKSNYAPFLKYDEKTFIWTRQQSLSQNDTSDVLMFSTIDNLSVLGEVFKERQMIIEGLPAGLTSLGNFKCSTDGSRAVLAATKITRDTTWYIFTAVKENDTWKYEGTVIESENWTSHPCFYENDNSLLFASVGPAEGTINYGKSDIYIIKKDSAGKWGIPENAGPELNSDSEDISPFYKEGNNTLHIASDREGTRGGLDIFVSSLENSTWQNPEPLDEINTDADEAFYFWDKSIPAGDVFLFASNRTGDWQIFGKWPTEIKMSFIAAGTVRNARTNEKIKGAEIVIREIPTEGMQPFYQSILNDTTGKYTITELERGREFEVTANTDDLFFDSFRIKMDEKDTVMVVKPDTNAQFAIELEKEREFEVTAQGGDLFYDTFTIKIEKEDEREIIEFFFKPSEKLTLRINFPTNKYNDPYEFTLDSNGVETGLTWTRVMDILAENIELTKDRIDKLLLVGHTDDVGGNSFNMTLGQNRVNFIIEELVKRGAPREILIGESKGEEAPLPRRDGEDLETFRKRLRRVELQKVMETDKDKANENN